MAIREKISQREAYRLRKALRKANEDYVALTNRFRNDFPGVNIQNVTFGSDITAVLSLAQRLGFCVIAKVDGALTRFYAVRPK